MHIVPAHVHSKHLSVLAVKLKTFLVVKSGCVFKSCKYLGVRKEILWNKLQTRSIPVGFFFSVRFTFEKKSPDLPVEYTSQSRTKKNDEFE